MVSLANVHVWATFCPVVSAEKTSQRHSHARLRLSPNCNAESPALPECFVIQLFPLHTILTNERVLTVTPAAFCLFLQPLFQGSPRSEHRAPGPRDTGLHFQGIKQPGFSYTQAQVLPLFFKKKCYLATGCPPPPEKMSQLNFLPAEPKIKAHAQ